MTNFKQGDKIRVKKPKTQQKSIGHSGGKSKGIPVGLNGEKAFLQFGTMFKVSSYTDENIVSKDSKPLPLIQRDFVNRNENINQLFELVEAADES